jgi:hypothetical protein
MWFRVWPVPGMPAAAAPWGGEGFRREGAAFRTDPGEGRRMLRYNGPVMDGHLGSSGQNRVGDVRVRFRPTDVAPGTRLAARIAGRAGPVDFVLDVDRGLVEIRHGGSSTTAPAAIPAGAAVDVSFADLLADVTVDGTSILAREIPEPSEGERPAYSVELGWSREA